MFPATDSMLSQLGIEVSKSGTKCLGLITEDRSKKSKVYFAWLDLSLWLSHDELKDVVYELREHNLDFKNLSPETTPHLNDHPTWQGHWWISKLNPIEIIDAQFGQLGDLWSQEDGKLEQFYKGDPNECALKLSVAIEELNLETWQALESEQKQNLLFARFLPAGMHKLEVQLFLRCKNN